jgi:cation diffusion facilitator CzcD-associated flavoprotein CzcO
MVQRSPTFLVAAPPADRVASILGRVLPEKLLHALVRGKNVALGLVVFHLMRRYPAFFKNALVNGVHEELKSHMSTEEVTRHFTPHYNPWDQRLCLSPAGDFFDSLREGTASVATGHIAGFTEDGILMQSGEHVAADVIVTATGLKLQSCFPMSTMRVTIDGQAYDPRSTMVYRGSMLSGVPNFAFISGYTNASWTLKADLTCLWVVRLLQTMERRGQRSVVPQRPRDVPEEDVLPLTSGYIQRAKDMMPKQGAHAPWRVNNNYLLDAWELGRDNFANPELVFSESVAASKL